RRHLVGIEREDVRLARERGARELEVIRETRRHQQHHDDVADRLGGVGGRGRRAHGDVLHLGELVGGERASEGALAERREESVEAALRERRGGGGTAGERGQALAGLGRGGGGCGREV